MAKSNLNDQIFEDDFFNFLTEEDLNKQNEKPIIKDDAVNVKTASKETNEIIPEIPNVNKNDLVISGSEKFRKIKEELNTLFLERQPVVDAALLVLITKQTLLLLGEPGSAKTELIKSIRDRIKNCKYFEWLLNRSSDPSEILGPFSIKGMEEDKFRRVSKGKLPDCQIGYMDEIYKANEPTLNSLLSIINEKVFYNDGVAVPVPLITMYCASNEMPEDESLMALHDRLILRIWVEYIADSSNRMTMYQNFLYSKNPDNTPLVNVTQVSINEIEAMQEACNKVVISKSVLNSFMKLIGILNRNKIVISDRRQCQCLRLLQGQATIAGRNNVLVDDFDILSYALWNTKEDIPFVISEVNKISNPYEEKLKDFRKQFEEIHSDITSTTNDIDKIRKGIESKTPLDKLVDKIQNVIKDASKAGKSASINDLEELKDKIIAFSTEVISSSLFGLDDNLGSDGTKTNPNDETDFPF